MAIKLRLALQNHQLQLVFKAAVFAALLALVKLSGFGIISVALLLAGVLLLYFQPIFQSLTYFIPLTIFLITALLVVYQTPGHYFWPAVLFLSLLFYLLLGVKNIFFVTRERLYFLFNLAILYLIFFLFFASAKEFFFIPKLILLFMITMFIFGEIIRFRRPLVNAVLALLLIQFIWAISLLPIGFFQSTNLAFLAVLALSDFTRSYFRQSLTLRRSLRKAILFAALASLILLTSKWGL